MKVKTYGGKEGYYICTCLTCKAAFIGVKLDTVCGDCAGSWEHSESKVHTVDPFAREKAIRKGELDSERPSFEEITGWLCRIPKTWLPALLIKLVLICEAQKVFSEGGLLKTVQSTLETSKRPSFLRNE